MTCPTLPALQSHAFAIQGKKYIAYTRTKDKTVKLVSADKTWMKNLLLVFTMRIVIANFFPRMFSETYSRFFYCEI